MDDLEVASAVFNALAGLDEMSARIDLREACFSTLMTSRMVFGDDRLMTVMTQDLVAARSR
jgi:hypothetical protein